MQTISRRVDAFPCIDVHILLFLHIAIVKNDLANLNF